MRNLSYFCVLLVVYVCGVNSDGEPQRHWALLVAGSNTYDNYRHQADICHAYHVLHKHGIPDERIVVMMYDDIANNEENPFPGNIINEPNGKNVYPGVPKDYTGNEVRPEVFLKVLSGDEKGLKNILGRSGKVIKSGPNDHVFVNFADHGAPGLLAFPSDVLHAKDLNSVILNMYENKQYKEMVFYVEACESGSMFHKILRDDINVFATTAANPRQSSYACYFDNKRQTYLGDVYSVNWMQDSDMENLGHETLQKQFRIVRKETNESHVMEYGDLSMKNKKVGDFQGNLTDSTLKFRREKRYNPNIGAVRSEDVKLAILKRKADAAKGEEKLRHMSAINTLLAKKEDTKKFFKSVVQSLINAYYDAYLQASVEITDFTCYQKSVDLILKICPGLNLTNNDYALRNLRALVNLCEEDIPKEKIWSVIKMVVSKSPICNVF